MARFGPTALLDRVRSTGGLGVAVVVLLGFQICVLAISALAFVMRARLLARIEAGHLVTREQANARDVFVEVTSGLWLLVFLATIVVWLIWQHHAQSNARALTNDGTTFTPGWAVGWWFVPFANLGKPFQSIRELWKASEGGDGWRTRPTWPLIGWWWASWLGYNLIGNVALFSRGDTAASLRTGDAIEVASNGLGIVAGVLAIMIVRSVTDRQRVAAGEAIMASIPPPPAPLTPPPPVA
jgi:Domain of unknown function (DUF4328)